VLNAFHDLRQAAGPSSYVQICETAAIEYQRWAQHILPHQGKIEDELPTLGVLMCWHTHMLNPGAYDKDCDGAYPALKGSPFPLTQVVRHDFNFPVNIDRSRQKH